MALIVLSVFAGSRMLSAATTNLVDNPSVELSSNNLPSGWTNAKTGTNTTAFNYLSAGHTGTHSLQVQMTKRSSGNAKWYFTPVMVAPNTKYTFTDWYESNIPSHLQVFITKVNGATSTITLNDQTSSSGWKQASGSFTTPANAKTLTVYHYINRIGQLTTDDFDLEGPAVTPPSVSITTPAANSTVSSTQAVSASASDAVGVAGVQFKLDNVNLGAEDITTPYSVSWDTKAAANGNHTLSATVRSKNGLTTTATETVNVQNIVPTPPTVSFSAPANGSTVSGTTQAVSANASDTIGVTGVQFKLDNVNLGAEDTVAPYGITWDTTAAGNGNHSLTAVARNGAGLTATAAETVNVQNTITPPPVSPNLILNPSVEASANGTSPDSWLSNNWGTNTTQFTYLSAGGHTGNRSVKTQITSYSSGDAKWYFNSVNVDPNKSYTFTDYYQASVDTEAVAQYTDASGNLSYVWLGSIPASAGWTTFSNTFTTPASAKQLTIFHLIAKVGWLNVDDASLTTTPPPPPQTDVIPNNSLEYASPTDLQSPAEWTKGNWGTNTSTFEYLNEGHTGNRSVKVTVSNYTDGDAKWYFNPITTLQPGKMYRFSTWYKTNTIPHAVAMFIDSAGTEKYFGMPNPQPNGTANWQFYTDTFTVPLDAKSVSAFLFLPNNGWLQTDDYSITDYQPVGFNRPLLTLTFDDGYEENVTNALPLMNQYGFKSTQCYETMDVEGNQSAINDIKTYFNSGHEICSHTVTHPFLTQIPQAQLTYELTHAQQVLQGIVGVPVLDFASPYGDYNQAVDTEIAKYYRSHRTVDEGFNSKDNFDIYRLRVQNMTPTTTLAQVQAWIDQAKATNTWLILVYHRIVTSGPEAFDTYQSDFAQQLQAISQSGITVKTWSSALDELTAQL